jgi:hypothetical protein
MSYGNETRRLSGLPLFTGATTIAAGNAVALSTASPWVVTNTVNATEEPIGVARASAYGSIEPVDIRDTPDIIRGIAAATIGAGTWVVVASAAATAGASGSANICQLGLAATQGASGTTVWALGKSVEHANPGGEFGYYLKIQQISGLI